jgi:FkbM family methyltransferase
LELNGGVWFNFEPHLAALYCAILRPGAITVDGGANIGIHALQMAAAVSPGGLVIAIEPVPELVQRLDQRRREHGMPEGLIRLVQYGLSSAPGEADFYQVLHPVEHEFSGLRNRHFIKDHQVQKIRVSLTTLDAVCADLPRLDFVKLDLEGAEMDALRGGRRTLERFRPIVSLEQDQYSPQYFGYTWENLLEYFASLRYEVYDLFGLRYTEAAMLDLCAVWDFIGVPAECADVSSLFDAVRRSMAAAGVKLHDEPRE